MFDFSQFGEAITSLIGSPQGSGQTHSADLHDLLQQAGLDQSALSGLSESRIKEFLADHGINPAQIMPGQLDQFLADLGVSENLTVFSGLFDGEAADAPD